MSVNRQSSITGSQTGSTNNLFAASQTMSQLSQQQKQQQQGPTVQLPYSDKQLRTCKACHRILTEYQFLKDGCRGCHPKGNAAVPRHKLNDYATPQFSGYVGIVDPSMSWVARVIGLGKKAPMGVYAAQVDSEGEDEDDFDGSEADDIYARGGDFNGDEGLDGEGVFDRFGGAETGSTSGAAVVEGSQDLPENPFEAEERAAKKSRAEQNFNNTEYDTLLDGLVDY